MSARHLRVEDAPSYAQTELIHTLKRAGLATNLRMSLDAGDALSYTSGQSWLDRSGNGYDFFRGATSGAEGSDPTFTGTAGQRTSSTYWSFDGGDYFTYDSANEAWMHNLHKANAKWTVLFWWYAGSTGAKCSLFDTYGPGPIGTAFQFSSSAANKYEVFIVNTSIVMSNVGPTVPATTWHMIALSVDAAAGASGGLWMLNDTPTTFNATYTSPSASNSSGTLQIGVENGITIIPNGSRMAMVAAWEGRALTQAELTVVYRLTKSRLGF